MLSESCDDRLFDVEGRNPGYRSKLGCSGLSVQARLGDIVAVAHPRLGGVSCDHAMASIVEQQVLQGVIGFLPGQNFVGLMGRQLLLDSLEQALVHDRRLLPGQDLALVLDLTIKEPVAEEVGEGASPKRDASTGLARLTVRSHLGAGVFGSEVADKLVDATYLQISPEDQPHPFGFFLDDFKLAVLQLIAKGQ